MTKILKINPISPEPSKIKEAAEVIKNGGTVAFPTETVYGLGADALNLEAIRKVFKAKGRPSDNPLIVHISSIEDLRLISKRYSSAALALMDKFWPGPLTLILKKKKIVSEIVTGGLDTVAVRIPDNKIALSLIKMAGVPLVAPSANLSGRPSPTRAKDVAADLSGKVDVIIDGGKTRIGIESTVIDMTTSPPTLLRPGGLPVEEIEKVVGLVQRLSVSHEKEPAKSPGMKYRHYAPKARMVIVEGDSEAVQSDIRELAEKSLKDGKKVGILAFHIDFRVKGCITKYAGSRPGTVAGRLFDLLRAFDRDGVDLIISEPYGGEGLKLGIADRLKRAAGHK
ncbi:MAG: L-threonylcarbamoyladenylate synthase [Deltaproteobacteria bacterium]|nr:L-threonylcarbamoyladenylate synthase [Deltaproteobacteria bacterium]